MRALGSNLVREVLSVNPMVSLVLTVDTGAGGTGTAPFDLSRANLGPRTAPTAAPSERYPHQPACNRSQMLDRRLLAGLLIAPAPRARNLSIRSGWLVLIE